MDVLKEKYAKLKRKFKKTSMELEKLKKPKKEPMPPSLFNLNRWNQHKKRVRKFCYSASTDESRMKGRAIPIKYFISLVSKSDVSNKCFIWYENGWKVEYIDPIDPLRNVKLHTKYDWEIAPSLYRAFLMYLIKYKKIINRQPHKLPSAVWLEDYVSIIECDTDPDE